MVQKEKEKEKAILLRKQGFSYREILEQVPVAKSTLSLWLRSVGLSKQQKQRLTKKRFDAGLRGAQKRKEQRIKVIRDIDLAALKDIKTISKKELWLMGVALYWAEGSKEKEAQPGSGVKFSNSDPYMIKLFLKWLREVIYIPREEIKFNIFIHENSKNSVGRVVEYWSKICEYPVEHFSRIYFKKNKIKTNRKNTEDSYFGLVRVEVRASSILNRKIAGWVKAINKYYWGIV